MAFSNALYLFLILAYFGEIAFGQEDSLRSALNAIDRRQRDLSDYEDDYGYSMDRPDDISFLNTAANYPTDRTNEKGEIMGRPLIDYLDDDIYDQNALNKKISSSFRERVEEDKKKQMEEFARSLMTNLENSGLPVTTADDDYISELWERYYGNDINQNDYGRGVTKRYYYPTFGIDNIGLRKRGRIIDPGPVGESLYGVHHHVPREDNDDYQMNYLRNRQLQQRSSNQNRQFPYQYPQTKRFPVTKRNSNYFSRPAEYTHEEKRSIKKQTDPKVEKDLSNIFGESQRSTSDKSTDGTTTTTTVKPSKKATKPVKKEINKEIFAPVASESSKPLQINKKSIDWSDYFGLDRRKKSSNNGLDKEWLLERYHKAIAVSDKKRNAEISLQNFRNHDEPSKKEGKEQDKTTTEEKKIKEMDTKLKSMEDRIVDDALKYTGAHEDESDSTEIQQVKDNLIGRLAAAYSLEKMRLALEEYKNSIEKEKERLRKEGKLIEDDYTSEEKRTSVPRKEAIDESKENKSEADNNIKCTSENEDCHEQNYKIPRDILETHFSNGQCPGIQRACSDVASVLGHYGHIFERACNMHQICLLCSNNSWFSPTRQCNMLFLAKAYDLCKGNLECQKEAHRSIHYLLNVNRSLQVQSTTENCDISCSDTEYFASK